MKMKIIAVAVAALIVFILQQDIFNVWGPSEEERTYESFYIKHREAVDEEVERMEAHLADFEESSTWEETFDDMHDELESRLETVMEKEEVPESMMDIHTLFVLGAENMQEELDSREAVVSRGEEPDTSLTAGKKEMSEADTLMRNQ